MNPDPEKHEAATDPRLLLPEWLRDSDAHPDSVTPSGKDSVNAASQSSTRRSLSSSSPGSGWGSLPDAHTSFEPSLLVQPDDLPAWIRKLPTDAPEPPQQAAEGPVIPEPIDRSAESNISVTGTESGTVAKAEQHEDRSPARQSDLSMTGFLWISGASLLILALALIVIFR